MSDRLTPEPKTRRDILSWAAIGAASVTVLGTCGTMARLVKPRLLPEAASRVSIGHPEEFIDGTEKIIAKRNVVIVATQDGVAAISLVCTHLGCIVARTAKGFSCPCHGSDFDDQGKILGGPAPKGLPWLEVSRRADGKLQVDLKQEVALGTFYSV
jgi:cytochrome b6-f complex iron-sulfur subunit